MRRILLLAATVAALAGCGEDGGERPGEGRARAPEPAAPAPAPGAGDPATHLRALAAAARAHGGTRAAGTPGARASEEHVAARLRAAGLRVELQEVRFPFFDERRPPLVRAGGTAVRARTLLHSGSGTVRGPVREVGLGCARADLAGVGAGDVVLARRGTCRFSTKARLAQEAGAGALLVADRAERPVAGTLGRPGAELPVVALGAAGGRAVRGAGRVTVRVDAVSERRTTRNVLGELPGPGGRVVLLGAHLDSVAEGPGMNDDASGSAAVLAAAERLARRGARGVRVAFWGAEELGLIGSRRHVAGLDRAERRRILAYLNLDMVGTPDGRAAVYDTDDRLERVLRATLGTDRETAVGGDSDHAPFARAGVPVGGVFTGIDDCYHRACDDADNVDVALVREVSRAVEAAALRIARDAG